MSNRRQSQRRKYTRQKPTDGVDVNAYWMMHDFFKNLYYVNQKWFMVRGYLNKSNSGELEKLVNDLLLPIQELELYINDVINTETGAKTKRDNKDNPRG